MNAIAILNARLLDPASDYDGPGGLPYVSGYVQQVRAQRQVQRESGGAHVDHVDNALFFEVLPRDVFGSGRMPASDQGMIWQHSEWEVPDVRS